ncbi:hypothetical protein EI94DRAFT_1697890 [Lactarius quietus]|nr:hypothetical protein EI94DRAFT_1697890 [Lactarius quietus]
MKGDTNGATVIGDENQVTLEHSTTTGQSTRSTIAARMVVPNQQSNILQPRNGKCTFAQVQDTGNAHSSSSSATQANPVKRVQQLQRRDEKGKGKQVVKLERSCGDNTHPLAQLENGQSFLSPSVNNDGYVTDTYSIDDDEDEELSSKAPNKFSESLAIERPKWAASGSSEPANSASQDSYSSINDADLHTTTGHGLNSAVSTASPSDSLLNTANHLKPRATEILNRLENDQHYLMKITPLFSLTNCQANALSDLVMCSQPYQNKVHIFCQKYNYLFPIFEEREGEMIKVPVPMVALVATALYATIYEWPLESSKSWSFGKRAFHLLMADIYVRAFKVNGNDGNTGVPIANLIWTTLMADHIFVRSQHLPQHKIVPLTLTVNSGSSLFRSYRSKFYTALRPSPKIPYSAFHILVVFASILYSAALVCVMATPTPNSPANSSDSDSRQPLTVNAWVTFHTKTRGTGKGKKAKTVTTKETRAKEFVHVFVDDEVNYLVFLQAILTITTYQSRVSVQGAGSTGK